MIHFRRSDGGVIHAFVKAFFFWCCEARSEDNVSRISGRRNGRRSRLFRPGILLGVLACGCELLGAEQAAGCQTVMELAGRTGSAVKKAYVAQHSADLIFNEGVVGAAKDDGVDFAAVFADEAFKHVGQVGSIQMNSSSPARRPESLA